MPRDPHDRTALTWTYRLPVHHPRAEVVVVVGEVVLRPEVVVVVGEVVLRPEVEVVGAEVGVEVLHHPEVAGAAGAVEAEVVQSQNRSLREEAAGAVQREALFVLAEVEAVRV
jgi:hypothetical protein